MSLNALFTATAGLQATQTAIGIVSQNVANASTAGYVRRDLTTIANPGGNAGVATAAVTRALNTVAQKQVRLETSGTAYTGQMSSTTGSLDALYGTPGASTALDGVLNTFTQALQGLTTSPSSTSAQSTVVSAAATMAQKIAGIANGVQNLRTGMETQLAADTGTANTLLKSIAAINLKVAATADDATKADLQDQRDQQIDQLSQYMDVQTTNESNGAVTLRTSSGLTLVEQGSAVALSFDDHGTLSPNSAYSTDATKRGVGTITATTASGAQIDLIGTGAIRSGSIAAEIELRDTTLPEAQRQLDDLAAGLARSLSDRPATGTAATTPAGTAGYAIDLSNLQAGNAVTVTTTQNGVRKNIILVPTYGDAPATIDPSLTNDPSATVKTIAIAKPVAGAASPDYTAAIQAALGTNYSVSTGASSGTVVIGPSAAGSTAGVGVAALAASVTVPKSAGDIQTGSGQLAVFVDSASPNDAYTGSFEGGSHLTGLAQRLTVNPSVKGSTASLISYSASALSSDTTRPTFLYQALTSQSQTFSAASGIGGIQAPFTSTVQNFAQQVINAQGANADQASQLHEGQQVALQTAQSTYAAASGVNIDTEMSKLISLQTAYSANARVLSAAKDMLDTLLRI